MNTLDTPSVITRSANDCWKYVNVMRGIDDRDQTTIELPDGREGTSRSMEGYTVGIPKV